MATIRFEREDVKLFACASHDRNPLHLSAQYARKTIFGEPVVFGVLAVLKMLGCVLERHPIDLESATVQFRKPLFVCVDYALDLQAGKRGQIKVKISDTGTTMMTATLAYRAESGQSVGSTAATAARHEAATWHLPDLRIGLAAQSDYAPEPNAFRALLDRCRLPQLGNAASPLSALLLASYLVGMELPGESALFSKLTARFNVLPPEAAGPISYRAEVTSFHDELGMLETAVSLAAGATPYAKLEVSALVRPESPALNLNKLTAALPASEALRGKTALVVGGSRGLGAAIVAALASQGCDVFLNYFSSNNEAEALVRSLPPIGGAVKLLQGDAADVAWCLNVKSMLVAGGGLDILVCSAVPSLRTLPFGLESIDRVRKFLDTSISLSATPLAAFGSLLESRAGFAVIVSTSYAAENCEVLPADLHHYVASKGALEGLTRSLAAVAGQTRFLVARPPRLLTDQTNGPMARSGSLSVEKAAAVIVSRLASTQMSGRYTVLDDFGPIVGEVPECSDPAIRSDALR